MKYEADSVGKLSDYGAVYHNFLGATPMQNLMGTPVTDGGPSPVPEPSAIFLMIGGLGFFVSGFFGSDRSVMQRQIAADVIGDAEDEKPKIHQDR